MRAILSLALLASPLSAQDTDWLSYGGGVHGRRHSELAEINTTNAAKLVPQWIFQTGLPGRFQSVPLVTQGRIYFTGPSNHAWALDALTGASLWHYTSELPTGINLCCGQMNRGFAISGDRLFKVNVEGDLVALEIATGRVAWKTKLADFKRGYSATGAPLIVKDMVLTGIAGAEFGTRGFIDAYRIKDGMRVWRFWTIPAPAERGGETWPSGFYERGGGSTWITGTYDPDLNLLYWGTGNPGPDMDGEPRPGDNLYSCSVVALNPDTGELKWHYQFTPHDVHDWDSVGDPVLADIQKDGRSVKALLFANRLKKIHRYHSS